VVATVSRVVNIKSIYVISLATVSRSGRLLMGLKRSEEGQLRSKGPKWESDVPISPSQMLGQLTDPMSQLHPVCRGRAAWCK